MIVNLSLPQRTDADGLLFDAVVDYAIMKLMKIAAVVGMTR